MLCSLITLAAKCTIFYLFVLLICARACVRVSKCKARSRFVDTFRRIEHIFPTNMRTNFWTPLKCLDEPFSREIREIPIANRISWPSIFHFFLVKNLFKFLPMGINLSLARARTCVCMCVWPHTSDTRHIIAHTHISLSLLSELIWNSNQKSFYAITECLVFCCLRSTLWIWKLHQTVLIGVFMWILCVFRSLDVCFSQWMFEIRNLLPRFKIRIIFVSARSNDKQTKWTCACKRQGGIQKSERKKRKKNQNVSQRIQIQIHSVEETINRKWWCTICVCVHYVWTGILAIYYWICVRAWMEIIN